MANIKLILEYDGTNYHGWQIQPDVPTIQGEIERALKKVFKQKISTISAGRTDAGVHAKGQVVNFKSFVSFPSRQLVFALNSVLSRDIRVVKAQQVPDDFHARYSACYKIYRYLIYNQSPLPPWYRNFTWLVGYPLNCDLMRKAADYLIGRHDFSSFQNQGSPSKNPIRNLEKIKIVRKASFISILIKADGFLYKMARNITGTLVEIGKGKIPPYRIDDILKAKDRRKAGPTAPPQGLYLWRVGYSS